MHIDTSKELNCAVVVIPTYNEVDSIGKLITHLFETTFPSINLWNMHIVVVDGNSPDGTAKSISKLKSKYNNLHLIVEDKKDGIGSAYFKGFQYATDILNADVLIEFDGDFQHPPAAIPLLLQKIEDGADLVLGSRRLRGGSYPEQWGLKRLVLSKFGGFVARFILFFPTGKFFQVSDPTTGLKATRVGPAYKQLDFKHFFSKSFGYKLEMLYYLLIQNIKVAEIPLPFQLRTEGESKIEPGTAGEILRAVLKLRIADPGTRRFLKFGIVGFVGYLVNALGVEFFSQSRFTEFIASKFNSSSNWFILSIFAQSSSWSAALATELAIISNFTWNNVWTFNHLKIKGLRIFTKFLHFNLTSLGAIVLQFFAIGAATLLFGNTVIIRQIALILAIGLLVVPYNWLMNNRIIWKKKSGIKDVD